MTTGEFLLISYRPCPVVMSEGNNYSVPDRSLVFFLLRFGLRRWADLCGLVCPERLAPRLIPAFGHEPRYLCTLGVPSERI